MNHPPGTLMVHPGSSTEFQCPKILLKFHYVGVIDRIPSSPRLRFFQKALVLYNHMVGIGLLFLSCLISLTYVVAHLELHH